MTVALLIVIALLLVLVVRALRMVCRNQVKTAELMTREMTRLVREMRRGKL